jgi:hypothetical protein
VHGAINGTHIFISKPNIPFVKNYFYHKIRRYLIVAHAILNVKRCFLDVYVGLPGSVNNS